MIWNGKKYEHALSWEMWLQAYVYKKEEVFLPFRGRKK